MVYTSSGALKAVGTSGTVTTIAPAEPHCPSCGRDFVKEWQNLKTREHFTVCLPCMVGALDEAGISRSKYMVHDHLKAAA